MFQCPYGHRGYSDASGDMGEIAAQVEFQCPYGHRGYSDRHEGGVEAQGALEFQCPYGHRGYSDQSNVVRCMSKAFRGFNALTGTGGIPTE